MLKLDKGIKNAYHVFSGGRDILVVIAAQNRQGRQVDELVYWMNEKAEYFGAVKGKVIFDHVVAGTPKELRKFFETEFA